MKLLFCSLVAALLACMGCGLAPKSPGGKADPARTTVFREVASPMPLTGLAYESASLIALPAHEPEEHSGLHNVYHLSENVVSGSEPRGRAAFQELGAMGIRTVISVDGSEPDVESAAELGMRYVHVPIQYSGITEDELLRLTKTYRQLEGPFYVHCFHGKHRGPAAAAVGRLVLDGASRQTAIAEMRQYCGTSSAYEGLYRAIALSEVPDEARTRGYAYGFDPVQHPEGLVGYMVSISRAHDLLLGLRDRDWRVDPEHPDVDPLNEARKLHQAFQGVQQLKTVQEGPDDLRRWFEECGTGSRTLVAALQRLGDGQDPGAAGEARESLSGLKQRCSACHAAYRN